MLLVKKAYKPAFVKDFSWIYYEYLVWIIFEYILYPWLIVSNGI